MFKFIKKSKEMEKEVVQEVTKKEIVQEEVKETKVFKELIKYVRNSKGHPIGVLLATGKNKIGFSLCHKDDKWDKNLAKKIARERANSGKSMKVPYTLEKLFEWFKYRANNFYN